MSAKYLYIIRNSMHSLPRGNKATGNRGLVLTGWDNGAVSGDSQLVRGRATMEGEVHSLDSALLRGAGLGAGDEAESEDERAGELHFD